MFVTLTVSWVDPTVPELGTQLGGSRFTRAGYQVHRGQPGTECAAGFITYRDNSISASECVCPPGEELEGGVCVKVEIHFAAELTTTAEVHRVHKW